MFTYTLIIIALFLAALGRKAPCDTKLECALDTFETDDRALCLGYRACYKAYFGTTDYNPICSGAESCKAARVKKPPAKFLCNGFKSCYGIKKGLFATEKVACNGLQSCREIIGKIQAPQIACDGDISCNNKKIVATGTPPAGEVVSVTCNGNKACVGANIFSDYAVNCDGDTVCKDANIQAPMVGCQGKRGCFGALITEVETLYGYGFNAAAASRIIAPVDTSKTLEIRALGMNALLGAVVATNGVDTTIIGYGFRSLVASKIKCVGGSICTVTCKSNACKGGVIVVDSASLLVMDPVQCDPRDANYVGPSKKDPSLPAKALGINCPDIKIQGVTMSDEEFERYMEKLEKEGLLNEDYIQMMEESRIAEQALDAMIAEKVAAYEDNLDAMPEDLESELMVNNGQLLTSTSTSNVLTSNLLTALVVFIVTSVVSLCYIAYKFGGNPQTKPLLQ